MRTHHAALILIMLGTAAHASFFDTADGPGTASQTIGRTNPPLVQGPLLPSPTAPKSFFARIAASQGTGPPADQPANPQPFFSSARQRGQDPAPPSPPGYKTVMTTVFWVGESATRDNSYIANSDSAWDTMWREHYGRVDDPDNRCGYLPCGFVPQENPFYAAIPYSDLDESGQRKANAARIPWYEERSGQGSAIKNSWIEISHGGRTCYAQIEDVGPYETDDFAYVFGSTAPRNRNGEGAGLDVSPAVRDCLGMGDTAHAGWRFVPASSVPAGPWKSVITTRDLSW